MECLIRTVRVELDELDWVVGTVSKVDLESMQDHIFRPEASVPILAAHYVLNPDLKHLPHFLMVDYYLPGALVQVPSVYPSEYLLCLFELRSLGDLNVPDQVVCIFHVLPWASHILSKSEVRINCHQGIHYHEADSLAHAVGVNLLEQVVSLPEHVVERITVFHMVAHRVVDDATRVDEAEWVEGLLETKAVKVSLNVVELVCIYSVALVRHDVKEPGLLRFKK